MKKMSYMMCLRGILCWCKNEVGIENVEEVESGKWKEDWEIVSFKNWEELLWRIEKLELDNGILRRGSWCFVCGENMYEEEKNENGDNEYIGFVIGDEKYRNFLNKDVEIIMNDSV